MFLFKRKNFIIISIIFMTITAVLTFMFLTTSTKTINAFSLNDIEKDSSTVFVVKDYGGKVAVFLKNEDEPFIILETLTSFLPEADVIALQQGIEVIGSTALRELLEDFTS